jgi:predicted MFS family arabinose efflux permease
MNTQERKATFSLASIYSFRMLGLFMILPVFSLYGHQVLHASPLQIGLALGIYGLTQALLQIPFGMTSDHIGRKPVIITGLILFAIGSLVAASAHGITGIIVGRAIQGTGAIGSTITALVADVTQEERRMKAMAMIGMTIGLSFVVAMIVGPILNTWIGIPGIFAVTAGLAIVGIVVLLTRVPTPKKIVFHRDTETDPGQFFHLLRNKELLRLNLGIFVTHAILTATFIVIPVVLLHTAHLAESRQWMIYLPVLILAFIAMIPFIILAETKRKMKQVFLGAITCLSLSQLFLWPWHSSAFEIAVILFIFFTAFTLLEASLPSLVAKLAPVGQKGTAMGIYSSSQFSGIFFGGLVGGIVYRHFHFDGVFIFCAILGFIWLFVASKMQTPKYLSSKLLSLDKISDNDVRRMTTELASVKGVAEVMIAPEEGVAYLKVDRRQLDESALQTFQSQLTESTGDTHV